MSVTERPGWVTSDDRYFADKVDAEAHEYQLNRAAVLEEFMVGGEGAHYTDRGKSSARRIVGDFLDFLARKGAPMPWVDEEDEPDINCPEAQDFVKYVPKLPSEELAADVYF